MHPYLHAYIHTYIEETCTTAYSIKGERERGRQRLRSCQREPASDNFQVAAIEYQLSGLLGCIAMLFHCYKGFYKGTIRVL